MRYAFPHYRGKAEFIQPNPKNWQRIKKGMSIKEVIYLLGKPLDDFLRGGKAKKTKDCYYYYGYLNLPYIPHPRAYSFLIYFDQKGLVSIKEDPFRGEISENGVPTKPILISPIGGTLFSHYPRIIDVRWQPPAGEYPMKFEVEIGHGVPDGRYFDEIRERDLKSVYYCFSFVGAQPGRLRVRARNSCGIGPWSDFVNFEFSC
jgi:hypothetical protein